MRAIALVSMLLTTLVMLAVGVRLLLVARRTRELPELMFGVAFVASGVGQTFGQVGQRAIWSDAGPLAVVMNGLCLGIVAVGSMALWIVTRRVFNPTARWAGALCWGGCALTLLAWLVRGFGGDFVTGEPGSPGHAIHVFARSLLLAWTSLESTRHYRMLRKRLALGLADPMATNQIGLWAVAGYGSLMATLTIGFYSFVVGMHPLDSTGATLGLTALALAISASMWCAFFPPAALRRRIERPEPA